MHFWVREPKDKPGDVVTGTVRMLLDEGEDRVLKTKNGIVLQPQPHDDPNDPLNWPLWRRDLALLVIGLYSFIIGGMTPLLAPVMSQLETEFSRPLKDITFLVGAFMFALGVGAIFFAPTAMLLGKRSVYVISQLILIASLGWAAGAKSFGSLLGARILSGISGSPGEALPSATIAEIYFAHERAYRTGIYTLLLLGGKNLVPMVAGFIANGTGSWHWIFGVACIITGILCLATFLFVHETWWDRAPVPDRQSQCETAAAKLVRLKHGRPSFEGEHQALELSPPGTKERKPFFRNLALYSGLKSRSSWFHVFLRPFVLYVYPPVLFSALHYSLAVVWLSVIAETISTIFTNDPYNFPQTTVGLLYVGTFVGGCLGSAVAGKVSDIAVRWMCRKNAGVYEPEFRLIMIVPVAVTISIGLIGFGWSTFDQNLWIVPTIFLGLLGFGSSLASTVAITYCVDCYRLYAAEALVSMNFLKNVLGLVFSIFVPPFLESSGSQVSFVVYGCIELGLCLLTIPMYHFGKIARAYCDEHNYVQNLYATDDK